MKIFILSISLLFGYTLISAQVINKINLGFKKRTTYQTIKNFGASDAWAAQFVGNWPEGKKNAIADWLFSMDTLANGNPRGIGLTMWRYNLGAGSAEQNKESGIKDEWRRASLTLSNSDKIKAQNWFLEAAKKRGVPQYLGFFNSPPVQLTKNGKAFADSGKSNIDSRQYHYFAEYTVEAIRQIEGATGITLNYISTVNEPQWDWSDGGQEGCPYNNMEISALIKAFDSVFKQHHMDTKLMVPETGSLKYLLPANDKKEKDNQLYHFFDSASPLYVGNLSNVSKSIAAHSYFTTSPFYKAMKLRSNIKNGIARLKDAEYWQSEYCILGDNDGEIKGNKKDTGMNAALYIAKVIYEDLVGGNAAAWHWWTALSAYDYKDGLVYVDKKELDGNFSDSKMLWALGNYSRFERPGMKRIDLNMPVVNGVYVSAYKDINTNEVVCVMVNETEESKSVLLSKKGGSRYHKKLTIYTTDITNNLAKQILYGNNITLPPKSVVTAIFQ